MAYLSPPGDANLGVAPSSSLANAAYTYEASESPSKPEISQPAKPVPAIVFPSSPISNAWPMILSHLDLASFVVSQSVCLKWRSISMLYNIGVQILEKSVERCIQMANTMQARVNEEMAFGTQDNDIVSDLAQTLLDEQTWLRTVARQATELSSSSFFLMMFNLHVGHVRTVLIGLEDRKWKELGNWSLARSLRQMQVLFPQSDLSEGKMDFARIIRDRDARSFWTKALGSRTNPCLTFDSLASALRWSPRLIKSLKTVLDFPTDGIITPYKWYVFSSVFGPWKSVKANFERFVLGGGFAGCIGRKHCEDILRKLPLKSVILRSSRTHSSMLVLSYRPSMNSAFVHLTNNSNFWTMPEFSHHLKSICREKGSVSSSSNVPMEYFVLLFERCGYMVAPVTLFGELLEVAPSHAQPDTAALANAFATLSTQSPVVYSYGSISSQASSNTGSYPLSTYSASPSASSSASSAPSSSSPAPQAASNASSSELRSEYYAES